MVKRAPLTFDRAAETGHTGVAVTHVVRCQALGVDIRLRVQDERLVGVLRELLVDLSVPAPTGGSADGEGDALMVSIGGTGPWKVSSRAHTAGASTFGEALANACAAVNLNCVAHTPLLAFHCAVVAHGDRTVAVPGASGLGKTTLTAALLMDGWDYVSDEALALDRASGDLVGYPRPLALSHASARLLGIDPVGAGVHTHEGPVVRAAQLGASIARRPAPVTDVVLLSPGAAQSTAAPPHRGEALAELFRRGFTVHEDPTAALRSLAEMLRGARIVALSRDEPTAMVRALEARLGECA